MQLPMQRMFFPKKGASYRNVYFASDSEAGKFSSNIYAYPTTYVVDRNGKIVGEPIVGAITEKKQSETLKNSSIKPLLLINTNPQTFSPLYKGEKHHVSDGIAASFNCSPYIRRLCRRTEYVTENRNNRSIL